MHRRKDIWGVDAEEFRPERWQNGNPIANMYYYVPFLRGPRSCPGREFPPLSFFSFNNYVCVMSWECADSVAIEDFALTEASYLIIRLVQEFRTIRVARTDPISGSDRKQERFKMGFVIESADGCLLEFEK